MPIFFPVVAYELRAARFREAASKALDARSVDQGELRRAYLRMWGKVGDDNFSSVLRKWNLSLEESST